MKSISKQISMRIKKKGDALIDRSRCCAKVNVISFGGIAASQICYGGFPRLPKQLNSHEIDGTTWYNHHLNDIFFY